MIGYPSGQDGATLPARDFPFCSRNKISPKSKRVAESFLSQSIFSDSKKIFCDLSDGMELENERTESVNEKESKNVEEFQEYILQQKPANTKVKTQTDMTRCFFMDLDFVSVHKNAKKELGQYQAILTSRLSIAYIYIYR